MPSSLVQKRFERGARAALLVALASSGCLLLSPLGDFEEATATGGKGGSAQGGNKAQGGSKATGGTTTDGGGGASGAEGGDGGGGIGGGGGCTTNADCVDILGMTAEEQPARCRPSDHTCVPLRTNECFLSYGDPTDDDAVFLGAFADYYTSDPSLSVNAYPLQLAVEELNETGGDRPPGLNGAQVVVTICDNSSKGKITAAMAHLVDELEVPAVLATLKPADLMAAFQKHSDVLYLSPVGRTAAVTELDASTDPDHVLIWNLLGQPSDYTRAYVLLLERIEEYAKNRTDRSPLDAVRVALIVNSTDASNAELGSALAGALTFNGMTAAEQSGPTGNFRLVTMTSASTTAVTNVVNNLIEFVPDIVVSATGVAFTRDGGILRQLETNWESAYRPFYVLSPYNAGDLEATHSLLDDIADPQTGSGEENPQSRFLGLSLASPENLDLQNEYARALGDHFQNPDDRIDPDTGNYYDAMYFLAYAAYAAGLEEPLTGRRMADGLERLMVADAAEFGVGRRYIKSILDTLDQGDDLALRGTLGPPNFTSGYREVAGALFCYEIDTEGSSVLRKDVLTYFRDTEGSDGLRLNSIFQSFPCFDNFYP